MYHEDEAVVLYMEAREAGLSGAELLEDPQKVMRDCNGIGAAWMPERMRKLATLLNPVMEIPAAIHDRRYTIGGEAPGQRFADAEFWANTQTMIERRYAWWNPLRYVMRHRANLFYSLLRDFGSLAWKESGDDNV